MSSLDDPQIQQKQELLRELLRRQREQDAQSRVTVIPAPSSPQVSTAPVVPIAPPPQPRPLVTQQVGHPVATRPRAQRAQRPAAERFDTSLFTQDQIDRVGVAFVRGLAVFLLVASFVGSILAFNGRYTPSWRFWEGISPIAATAGIAVQGYLTLIEWWRSTRRWDLVYLGHLAVDALLTFIGYWLLLGPWFTNGIAVVFRTIPLLHEQEPSAQLVAQALLAVCSIIVARLPELWLVKK